MIIYAVVISNRATKQEYTKNLFLYPDNAADHADTIALTLNEEFEVSVEPFQVVDAENDNFQGILQ
jgi:hypothetical protein